MKKRYTSLLLAALAAVVAMGGCSGGSSGAGSAAPASSASAGSQAASSEAPTEKQDSGEKKTISAIAFERGKCPASEGTMEDNRWTKWINENSPVNVEWIPIPRTESVAKTNALFASGSAPDLVWEFNKGFMNNLIQQGVLQPVDDYIEQYSTSYKQYLADHPELRPYVTSDLDGKMYAFSSARTPLAIANHAIWIRQDWLDNLGLSTPGTMEELNDVLVQFTTGDPDRNGENDTFGLGFNYNLKGIAKALFGGYEMLVQDGKLVDWSTSPGYRDFLTQMKQWYSTGVMDPEYITDTNYERQRQLLVTGKVGVYFGGWDMANEWRELKQNVPEANLVPLEPVSTSYGRNGCYQEPPAFRVVCMNKDAKDPEACIQFLDWMLTDGWKPVTYGIEGEHHRLVDGVPQTIDPDKNATELDYAFEYPLLKDEIIDDVATWFKVTAATDDLAQQYAAVRAISLETQMKNKYRRDLAALPSSELTAQYNSEVGGTLTELEDRCITDAGYSVDEALAEMESIRTGLGFGDVMAEYQAWYDSIQK